MRRKVKILSILLSLSLLFTIFTGCSKSSETGSSDKGSKSNSDGKMTLQFWTWHADKVRDDSYAVKAVEDRFNVKIEQIGRDRDSYEEKLQLKITSGDIPDYWNDLSFPNYDKLVDQGVVAELPIELIEDHAPNYMKWLKSHLGDDPFKHYMRNGKNYSMPIIWTLGPTVRVVGIREDWLNNVGISKVPETLDELEVALRKFREADPDGNGKKDTYGWTGKGEDLIQIFSPVFGAYGVYPGIFVEEDGKIVRGEIEPGTKEALSKLREWYKDGLIDPEFVVNKDQNVDDKVMSDKAGVTYSNWWNFIPGEAFTSGKYFEEMPDATWAIIGEPEGPNGKKGTVQNHPVTSSGLQFGKHMEKDRDKMIKYLQVFDATCFDLELYETIHHGEEGTTYEITEDGDYAYLPPYDQEEKRVEFGIGSWYEFPGSFNDYDFQAPFMTKSKYMDLRKESETKGEGKYDILQPIHKEEFNKHGDNLNQFAAKNFIDFITGRTSLDQFDQFVTEWNKMGGDKVMEEAQKKYDEFFK